MDGKVRLDEIGPWSEIKLDIVRQYAGKYTQILDAQKRKGRRFRYVYIDAFCGAGVHIAKSTREFVLGSPLNALNLEHPFEEYHFIDLDKDKAKMLREIVGDRPDVHLHKEDCNRLLLESIFPRCRWEDYVRALCLLDPYGLDLDWEVIKTAWHMLSIEIFLNFPTMDINRNVLPRDPAKVVCPKDIARMNAFWGDGSWRQAAYSTEGNLFGFEMKESNKAIAWAFRDRIRDEAGFAYVPDPIPMRNTTGAVLYYLFFASQKPVAKDIVTHIFDKYRDRGKK